MTTKIASGGEPSEPRQPDDSEAAQAVFAATAQIGLAMRESHAPVVALGSLITSVAQALTVLRGLQAGQALPSASPGNDPQALIEQLHSDVFKAVEQLQFYDRMVQHLSRLEDYLIHVANQLGSGAQEGAPPGFWEDLHAKLRERLISDEQRGLFDLILAPSCGVRVGMPAGRKELSSPGSCEMF